MFFLLHLGVKPKSRVLDNFQVRKFTCSKKYFISANLIKKILLIQIIRKSKFSIYLEFQELIVLYILLEFPGPHQISSRLRILSRYQKSDGISSISSDFPLKERCPWVKFRAWQCRGYLSGDIGSVTIIWGTKSTYTLIRQHAASIYGFVCMFRLFVSFRLSKILFV